MDLELNEIKQESGTVIEDSTASDVNSRKSLAMLGKDDIGVYLNERFVVLEDGCLNRERWSDNEEREVPKIWALKRSAVLKENENEILKQLKLLSGKDKKGRLQPWNGIPKTKVKSAMNKVNCILVKYEYKKTYDMVLYSWIIVSWYGWSE